MQSMQHYSEVVLIDDWSLKIFKNMTAIIATLNKHGVAIASDSAETLYNEDYGIDNIMARKFNNLA